MIDDTFEKSILNQLDPSPEQILPILQRDHNIVVTAGAGTGKTRTLVARYLSLVEEHVPLREIVAITFTKKAAREMRNRIREEVRVYLQNSELNDADKVFWREIYEKLDSARISTIHSLASDILRQHPAELGIDPKFELLDEGQIVRLQSRAIEAALTWGSEDPDAAVIYPVFGVWTLRRVIGELFSKRLEMDQALETGPDEIWKIWEPKLIQPLMDFVDDPRVVSALNEFQEYESSGIMQRAFENGDLYAEDLRIVNNNWKMIKKARKKDDWIAISRCLSLLRNHLKQKGKKDNWAPGNPRELVKVIQPIYDDLIIFERLDLAVDQKLAQEIIPGISAVFRYAQKSYAAAKDKLNGLDFDDLEEYALGLLRDFPSVRKYWQGQISSLLVDEYQDTNGRQRELVNLLNGDANNLFIVGDGKQSIYRFRGADVAVFRHEQEVIRRDGCSFELTTSYRAHADLLDDLNSMLEPVLGSDTTLSYVEPFSLLLPGRQDRPRYHGHPYIELHLAAGTKSDGAGRTSAEAVASRVRDIIQGSKSPEMASELNYGDVAVLCRASSSFSDFESAFEKAGIPYLTIAGQGFYDRPEIRDLLNALAAFADTQNDLAIAGLMRSPVVGIPDDVLLKYRDLQRLEKDLSLYETVRTNLDSGDDIISQRAKYVVNLVDEYSNLVGRISVADLLSRYLGDTGYLAAMSLGGHYRNIQNMKKLISDAQNSGVVGVSDFLNTISELRNVAVREGEAASVAEGSVQIMTVHQAKGLEFPVVVLGDASKKNRFGRDILIDPEFGVVQPFTDTRITEDDSGKPQLIKSSSLAYEIALARESKREEAEANRLLYVAATRAQELLIISGVLGKLNKNQALGKLGGWLEKIAHITGLRDIDLKFRVDGNSNYCYDVDKNGIEASINIYENRYEFELEKRIGGPILEPVSGVDEIPDLAPIRKDRVQDESDVVPVLFRVTSVNDRPSAPARIVGDIVHRALQLWKFPDHGESEFVDWVTVELIKRGVLKESEIKDGYRRAKKLLERFQSHELFNRMNESDRLMHEVPYSVRGDKEKYQSGIIDAMFWENGRWIIVEFKTDEIRDKKRFDWVWEHEDYQQQVAKYVSAVKTILDDTPQAILCFLNYEKRVHLVKDR